LPCARLRLIVLVLQISDVIISPSAICNTVYVAYQNENCNNIVDTVSKYDTFEKMIESFKHKGLSELFERGSSRKVRQDLQRQSLRRLDALDQAESLTDLYIPGFNFHGLQGIPKRYSIHINGPWCITFEWKDGGASKIDLEQYH
jgi:toxin HigB-1